MSEAPRSESGGEPARGRPEPARGTPEPTRGTPEPARTFSLRRSTELRGHLPLDALPPEALDRLRAGGDLTPQEMEMLRTGVLADSGLTGRLIDAAVSSGVLKEAAAGDDAEAGGLPGTTRRYEWTWRPQGGEPPPTLDPATYYELLGGRPDPNREFFLTARRLLGIVTWGLMLGLPVLFVALAMLSRQSGETVFFAGVFGLIISVMIHKSLPRSPFD